MRLTSRATSADSWSSPERLTQVLGQWEFSHSSSKADKVRLILSAAVPEYTTAMRRAVWLLKREGVVPKNRDWSIEVIRRMNACDNQRASAVIDEAIRADSTSDLILLTYAGWDDQLGTGWPYIEAQEEIEPLMTDALLHELIEIIRYGEMHAAELWSLDIDELGKKFLEARDLELFTGHDWARADFAKAKGRPYWTTDESTALVLGKNQSQFLLKAVLALPKESPFRAKYLDMHENLSRAAKLGKIGQIDMIDPELLCKWLKIQSNYSIDSGFASYFDIIADPICQEHTSVDDDEAANPNRLHTLYAIIIGLCIANYRKQGHQANDQILTHTEFDLEKISDAIKQIGLKPSKETIRRTLQSATKTVNAKHQKLPRANDGSPRFSYRKRPLP